MEAVIIILILVVAVLLSDTFVEIPSHHFGVVMRFGKRTGKIVYEGLRIKMPFIEKVGIFSTAPVRINIETTFTTKDKLTLKCEGSIEYVANPLIKDDKGRNVYITTKDIIVEALNKEIQSKLGSLGGNYQGEDFIQNRQAIGDIINSFLIPEKPYHLKSGEEVNVEDIINFYNSHWKDFKEYLSKFAKSHSPIEKRLGIDIIIFNLTKIDFSEEIKKSFEKDKNFKEKEKALQRKIQIVEEVIQKLGVDPKIAFNAVDVSTEAVKKDIISVEGSGNLEAMLALLLKTLTNKGG